MKTFSAYVPCFNNASTVASALHSLQCQSSAPAEVFLVDDGSTDESQEVAGRLSIPVVSMGQNTGRGAVRARAMEVSMHEFVLCCDATNQLSSNFAALASHWFDDPNVAVVYGRICQNNTCSLADRWRARHLFKVQQTPVIQHGALLCTYGCMLRRSSVLVVGNFDSSLRHSEDVDLGKRLLAAGFDVIFDPRLHVISCVSNSVPQVLERYWRWYAGANEDVSFMAYVKHIWYSLRVMALRDIRDGDLISLPLSLFSPHYQFWRSWWRRYSGRVQS
jgi:glycosyltransferase involved in cell wall biosynthesis